jgi:hypothetical protein
MKYYKIFERTKFHHKDTKNTKKLTTNGRELTRTDPKKSPTADERGCRQIWSSKITQGDVRSLSAHTCVNLRLDLFFLSSR